MGRSCFLAVLHVLQHGTTFPLVLFPPFFQIIGKRLYGFCFFHANPTSRVKNQNSDLLASVFSIWCFVFSASKNGCTFINFKQNTKHETPNT
jgi:hypothetical protein